MVPSNSPDISSGNPRKEWNCPLSGEKNSPSPRAFCKSGIRTGKRKQVYEQGVGGFREIQGGKGRADEAGSRLGNRRRNELCGAWQRAEPDFHFRPSIRADEMGREVIQLFSDAYDRPAFPGSELQ